MLSFQISCTSHYLVLLQVRGPKVKYRPPVALLKQLYQARRELVDTVCSERPDLSATHITSAERNIALKVEQKYPIGYCAIPKLASTFWKRVLPSNNILQMGTNLTSQLQNHDNSFTFMFVRNPYERVLSGYVDKLFTPNTLFWGWTGEYIMKQGYRRNPSERSLRCGHDVTFSEFFRYLIHSEKERKKANAHFTPMYRQCGACRMHYDVIGHFETFAQDADFIFETILNKTGLDMSTNIDAGVTERLRIENKIGLVFGMKQTILKCMNFQEALERVWRSLQIRGFLGKSVKMPLTLDESETFTAAQVIDVFLEARKKSSASDMRTNNKEALVEAFRQVPISMLEMYLELYSPDFELYGYDKRPAAIFSRTNQINNTYKFFHIDHTTRSKYPSSR